MGVCVGWYGIRNELDSFKDPAGWLGRTLGGDLLKCDSFCDTLQEIYQSEIRDKVYDLVYGNETIPESFASQIKLSEATRNMNYKVWGISEPVSNADVFPTIQENIDYMHNWMQKRLTWMDEQIPLMTECVNMLRAYNPNSGEHFYTASFVEINNLINEGWNYEGIGWKAPVESNAPVFRLYSGTDHHYTTSSFERDELIKAGWSYEGIGWYSDDNQTTPLYRQFNPNVNPGAAFNNSGSHNYTTDKQENDYLASIGWLEEGIGWYGLGQP